MIVLLAGRDRSLSAAGMILRYRRSAGIERLQMKWLAAAAAAVAAHLRRP